LQLFETHVDRVCKTFCEGEHTMTERMTESLAQVQQKQKMETRTAVKYIAAFTIVAAAALLGILGRTVLYAQGQDKDKYSLRSPGGIAFSDFRGYDDWSVVSSARTEEVLKVIVANPAMIKAYKAGVPGNGQPFPQGSMTLSSSGTPRRARKRLSQWMYPMSLSRLS
jgi:hypothetical protein